MQEIQGYVMVFVSVFVATWVTESNGQVNIAPGGRLQAKVMDPLGKWTESEKEAIRLFKQQWLDVKNNRQSEGSRVDLPTLTEKQMAWFYSLGRHRNGNTVGNKLWNNTNIKNLNNNKVSSRKKRQTRAGSLPTNDQKAIRKEIRQMSDDEWDSFTRAVYLMKNTFPDPDDTRSEFDIFSELHQFSSAPGAHSGAAFLPWHREYLYRMEQALRVHMSDAALPYWDSSLDQSLPNPRDSVLWTSMLLGNSEGGVFIGPFANFKSTDRCSSLGETLTRSLRTCPNYKTFFFTDRDLQYVKNKTSYSEICSYMDSTFEDDHGAVHVCVGGHMASIDCAPSDPVFYMHHTFVDCQWEEFRQRHQRTNREEDYPTELDGDIGGNEHHPYATMEPFFPYYNIHGISNHYTRYYYECGPRPVQCSHNGDCGSKYLWCDTRRGRCMSKIKAGGDCTGLPDEACYSVYDRCVNNVCGAVDSGSWWKWYNRRK